METIQDGHDSNARHSSGSRQTLGSAHSARLQGVLRRTPAGYLIAAAVVLIAAVAIWTAPPLLRSKHRRSEQLAARPHSPLPAASKDGVLDDPIDPRFLTEVPFGRSSFWIQPWRAYLDTWPASRLLDSVGINFNVKPAAAQATSRLLHESGFKLARIEINWELALLSGSEQVRRRSERAHAPAGATRERAASVDPAGRQQRCPDPRQDNRAATVRACPGGGGHGYFESRQRRRGRPRQDRLQPGRLQRRPAQAPAQTPGGRRPDGERATHTGTETRAPRRTASGTTSAGAGWADGFRSAGQPRDPDHEGRPRWCGHALASAADSAGERGIPRFDSAVRAVRPSPTRRAASPIRPSTQPWRAGSATWPPSASTPAAIFGPEGYDLEVWNELSFGSQFLNSDLLL